MDGKNFLGLNLKARANNPRFWITLIAVLISYIITSMGATIEDFDTWKDLLAMFGDFFSTPGKVIPVIVGIWGILIDPTTKGFKDSDLVLSYDKPGERFKVEEIEDGEATVEDSAIVVDEDTDASEDDSAIVVEGNNEAYDTDNTSKEDLYNKYE